MPQDIVYRVFGRELSMGKSMGLMSMVGMVAAMAKKQAEAKSRRGGPAGPCPLPLSNFVPQKVLDDPGASGVD